MEHEQKHSVKEESQDNPKRKRTRCIRVRSQALNGGIPGEETSVPVGRRSCADEQRDENKQIKEELNEDGYICTTAVCGNAASVLPLYYFLRYWEKKHVFGRAGIVEFG